MPAAFFVGLYQQADTKLLQAGPTLAAGDVTVKTGSGGTPANIATLPTSTGGQAPVYVQLSAAEMNAEVVAVMFSDAAGAEWCDLLVSLVTVPVPAGTVDNTTAPTNAQFDSLEITEATADHYLDQYVYFTGGALAGQAARITGYSLQSTPTRGRFTVETMTDAPAAGDPFLVTPAKA
jgi:hypothetical protein